MKKLIFSFKILSLLLFFGFITSCNKDNTEMQISSDDEMLSEDFDFTMEDITYSFADMDVEGDFMGDPKAMPQGGKDKCFEFVYPIDIVLPDSSVVTVNSGEEFRDAVKTWRENNPGVQGRPHVVFPVDVTLKDGTVKTINSKEEFRKLLKFCFKNKKHHPKFRPCFKPVFPLTIVYPDGTTVEYNTPEEMRTALQEWKQNNPDAANHPIVKMPFDVKLANGKIITINSKEDLRKLIFKCIKHRKKVRKHRKKRNGNK